MYSTLLLLLVQLCCSSITSASTQPHLALLLPLLLAPLALAALQPTEAGEHQMCPVNKPVASRHPLSGKSCLQECAGSTSQDACMAIRTRHRGELPGEGLGPSTLPDTPSAWACRVAPPLSYQAAAMASGIQPSLDMGAKASGSSPLSCPQRQGTSYTAGKKAGQHTHSKGDRKHKHTHKLSV